MNKSEMKLIPQGEAVSQLYAGKDFLPVTVIGTEAIRNGFDETCLKQALHSRMAPGVTHLVLNPDGHAGYGAPIGCVLVSPTHIYPGPVGVDIKCSISLLQTDIPDEALNDKSLRREIIRAIIDRIPTGAGRGQRSVPKSRKIPLEVAHKAVIQGASAEISDLLNIPREWASRCEDAFHLGHDDTEEALKERLDFVSQYFDKAKMAEKLSQLGSYGSGNHFGECESVRLNSSESALKTAKVFGLKEGRVTFLSHCGSRGFGYALANNQFKLLQERFRKWNLPFPGDDKELIYAPLGSKEADDYLDDMALGGNFATVNHLLINALVLEAFQEVLPGTQGNLVYFISHNIARREIFDGKPCWVHRKGATRAFPRGHQALKGTPFFETGHPILLPGNPLSGSVVMAAEPEAYKSIYSVNHGAGRAMGRKQAIRQLNQNDINKQFDQRDVLFNSRNYPIDEAPQAYKDFDEVLKSVESAGLAKTVARLMARFVIKDADQSLGGYA